MENIKEEKARVDLESREQIRKEACDYSNQIYDVLTHPNEHDNCHDAYLDGGFSGYRKGFKAGFEASKQEREREAIEQLKTKINQEIQILEDRYGNIGAKAQISGLKKAFDLIVDLENLSK